MSIATILFSNKETNTDMLMNYFTFQNVLTAEGAGFKIAMGAFDKTRPPVIFIIHHKTSSVK